jgi:acyl carrier protein
MLFEKIIVEVFNIPQDAVTDSLALADIPTWDSMVHMLFIVKLEETYHVQFTGDEIANILTVGDTRSVLITLGAKI